MWFVAVGNASFGPYSSQEILDQIREGKISFVDYVWKAGMPDFERMSLLSNFEAYLPAKPATEVLLKLQRKVESENAPPALPAIDQERVWFLVINQAQSGPYSVREVHDLYKAQQINGSTLAWKQSLSSWTSLQSLPELVPATPPVVPPPVTVSPPVAPPPVTAAPPPPPKANKPIVVATSGAERRTSARKPLRARIMLTNGESIAVAICQDVSIGGMLLVTNSAPGPVGSHIKINVTPEEAEVPQFTAEGEIVRILPENRGFSVKFVRITEETKAAIQKYISLSSL